MSFPKSKSLIHRLPLTEARNNLGKVVRRAHINSEMFILEKDGIPLAALMNISDFEDYLDSKDSEVNKEIKKSYNEYLQGKARPVEEFIAEMKVEYKRSRNKKK
jgi:hypothetical protein